MATARAIFQAHVDSLFPESIPITLQWSLPAGVLDIQALTIAANTTVNVPSGTLLICYRPPTTNGNALQWKGIAGDTGTPLPPNLPGVVPWTGGGGTTTIVMSSTPASTTIEFVFLG